MFIFIENTQVVMLSDIDGDADAMPMAMVTVNSNWLALSVTLPDLYLL